MSFKHRSIHTFNSEHPHILSQKLASTTSRFSSWRQGLEIQYNCVTYKLLTLHNALKMEFCKSPPSSVPAAWKYSSFVFSFFIRHNNRKATQYKSDYSIKRLIKRCAGCVEIKFFRVAFTRTSSSRWIMEMTSSAKCFFLPNATEKTPKAKAWINFQRLSGIPGDDDDDDFQRNLKVYRIRSVYTFHSNGSPWAVNADHILSLLSLPCVVILDLFLLYFPLAFMFSSRHQN